jgi:hypothetical protein
MTNEIYEVALSEDGAIFTPFERFTPGDVRLLENFVKFRVTVFGDFAEDEYRLRGFSGIVDDATTNVGGFGISPFGRYPFGDGGICLEDTSGDFSGELHLSGTLLIEQLNTNFSGTLSLSGDLDTEVFVVESGSMALSGDLVSVHTPPALGMIGGFGPTLLLGATTTFYQSVTQETNTVIITTEAAVAVKVPVAFRITSLYVVLTAAMASSSTHTYRFVVNGVPDNGIVLVLTTGQQTGFAVGSVNVNAGDTLSLEVAGTGGGIGAAIQVFTAGYEVL